MKQSVKPPIINCHTHIFKGEHVPPYLAKSFLPWPFYFLLYLPFVLKLFKIYLNIKNIWFKYPYKNIRRQYFITKSFIHRNFILRFVFLITQIIIVILALIILSDWLGINTELKLNTNLDKAVQSLISRVNQTSLILKILIVSISFLFIKSGRNLMLFLLKNTVKLFSLLPGKMTKELLERYVLLGRFTLYKKQGNIFSKLKDQYEPQSKFIVLPMDMTFMGAGKPRESYYTQMEDLAAIKEKSDAILPFVFIDPRRFEADKSYFDYTFNNDGKVSLNNCFIKQYIEDKKFNGFKIYPALGYYPFDEKLLALWKYAADNEIPITTHCIKGTIFYRGMKKKEWNYHPIFKECISENKKEYIALSLPQTKNIDFSINFTHPLNYLILLKEELLRIWVGKCSQETKDLFGYTDDQTKLKRDLTQLKICLAHFGGEDQWNKYLEADRYSYAQQIIKRPEEGIDFLYNSNNEFSWSKLEDCWKYVDWYSIICSMMLQHENVYADISYILHNEEIFPLLKETINHPIIGEKVLFGTDFFVVRNHKSEKDLTFQTAEKLTEMEFDKIARFNPSRYINN